MENKSSLVKVDENIDDSDDLFLSINFSNDIESLIGRIDLSDEIYPTKIILDEAHPMSSL